MGGRNDYSCVPQILAQVRSPHLIAVVLSLDGAEPPDLSALDFKLIDTVLSEPRFAGTTLMLSFGRRPYLTMLLPQADEDLDYSRNLDYFTDAIMRMPNLYDERRIALLPHGLPLSAAVFPRDM